MFPNRTFEFVRIVVIRTIMACAQNQDFLIINQTVLIMYTNIRIEEFLCHNTKIINALKLMTIKCVILIITAS